MWLISFLLLAIRIPSVDGVPSKQPQLAASGNTLVLTYAAGNTIYFTRSNNGGASFDVPTIVSKRGVLSLGMHRGPRIAWAGKTMVISAVAGEKGRGADGDLLAWRSLDNGKTWSSGVTVNDVPAATREGLHSMASNGKGLLFATWLDLREKGTRLYGSISRDGGVTWSKNVLVYASPSGSICQCCHPSAVVALDGRISVMFRNELNGARDMYIVSSLDGGRTFTAAEKLGTDTWMLNACPMDGGGIALDSNGRLSTVWRREKTIYSAAVGERETPLGNGKDAAVTVGRGGLYYAWSTPEGVAARFPGSSDAVLIGPKGTYPQLVSLSDGTVIAAWESDGNIVVQKIQ